MKSKTKKQGVSYVGKSPCLYPSVVVYIHQLLETGLKGGGVPASSSSSKPGLRS